MNRKKQPKTSRKLPAPCKHKNVTYSAGVGWRIAPLIDGHDVYEASCNDCGKLGEGNTADEAENSLRAA